MGKWRKNAYLESIILALQDCSEAQGANHWHWPDPLKEVKASLPLLQYGKACGASTMHYDVAGLCSPWWELEPHQCTPRLPETSTNLEHSAQPPRGLIYRAVFEWGEFWTQFALLGYAKCRDVQSKHIIPSELGCFIFVILFLILLRKAPAAALLHFPLFSFDSQRGKAHSFHSHGLASPANKPLPHLALGLQSRLTLLADRTW